MCPNTNKINSRFCKSSMLALEKKMVSSTNYKRVTLILLCPTRKPFKRPLSSTLNIILLKTSTTIVKRKRERGLLS